MSNLTTSFWKNVNYLFHRNYKRHSKRHISVTHRNRRLVLEVMESRQLLSINQMAVEPMESPIDLPPAIISTEAPYNGNPLISSSLQKMRDSIQEHISAGSEDLSALSNGMILVDSVGNIQVYVYVDAISESMSQSLQATGLQVESSDSYSQVVQGWVSYMSLDQLAQVDGVRFISPPVPAVTNTWSGSGAYNTDVNDILKAGRVHDQFAAYGITGSGVKIGVISDGITDWNSSYASGDLPNMSGHFSGIGQQLPDYPRPNEGTAMLEIVHDLAPNAELYFAPVHYSSEMSSAITYFQSQGVDVIVDDLSFPDQPFFQDGSIANAVADAVSSGIVYVTSAGNYANQHFQGLYQPYSTTTTQTFYVDGTATNVLPFPTTPGSVSTTTGYVYGALEWSDLWGGSSNNYDLYLFGLYWDSIQGWTWGQVASAITVQDGTTHPYPYEYISYNNTTYTEMSWVINKNSGLSNRELELYFYGLGIAGYYNNVSYTANDSIFGQAAVSSVISVGAIDSQVSPYSTVESFSSRGPSTIYTNFNTQTKETPLRQTLDGCGIDGVHTSIGILPGTPDPFSDLFYGTSAAAPDVAAIAALMLQTNSSLTPAAIVSALTSTAIDLYSSGYDNTSGYGRFDALGAVYKIFTPTAPQLSTGGSATNNTNPTITGTAPLLSYVHLYVDGVEKGTQQLSGSSNTYSISTGTLTAGSHSVTVKFGESSSTSSANLSNASPAFNLLIDTTAPSSVISFPVNSGAYTPANWSNISGTASDSGGAGVDLVQVSIKDNSTGKYWNGSSFGATSEQFFNATGTTNWTYAFPYANLSVGKSYTVRSLAKDTAGNNQSTSTTSSFTFNTATLYWDRNGATLGFGSGDYTWNSTSAYWSTSSSGNTSTRTWIPGSNAVFSGTAGTVTVSGTTSVNNVTFTVGGYVLTGGTLSVASNALIKIQSGTFELNNTGNFSANTNVLISNDSTLKTNGGSHALGSINRDGNGNLALINSSQLSVDSVNISTVVVFQPKWHSG